MLCRQNGQRLCGQVLCIHMCIFFFGRLCVVFSLHITCYAYKVGKGSVDNYFFILHKYVLLVFRIVLIRDVHGYSLYSYVWYFFIFKVYITRYAYLVANGYVDKYSPQGSCMYLYIEDTYMWISFAYSPTCFYMRWYVECIVDMLQFCSMYNVCWANKPFHVAGCIVVRAVMCVAVCVSVSALSPRVSMRTALSNAANVLCCSVCCSVLQCVLQCVL